MLGVVGVMVVPFSFEVNVCPMLMTPSNVVGPASQWNTTTNDLRLSLSLSLSCMAVTGGQLKRNVSLKRQLASRDIARISGFQMFAGDVAQFSSSAQLARSVRKSARIGRQTPRYLVAANDVET